MPWRRLIKEWLIYAAIMCVVFAVVFRNSGLPAIVGGLLISGPLYLGFGYVMAKFGYTRKTLADLRTPRASPGTAAGTAAETSRTRPAPTRRTSQGPNRQRAKRR